MSEASVQAGADGGSLDFLIDATVFDNAHSRDSSFAQFLEFIPVSFEGSGGMTASINDPRWYADGVYATRVNYSGNTSDPRLNGRKAAEACGRTPDAFEGKRINSAQPFTMNFFMDGHLYRVPDLYAVFIGSGYMTIHNNWRHYEPFRTWYSDQSMDVLAEQIDPVTKKVARCILTFSTKASGSNQIFTARFNRYLNAGTPLDFVDEFNANLASKRLESLGTWTPPGGVPVPNYAAGWKMDVRSLVPAYADLPSNDPCQAYHFVLDVDQDKSLTLQAADVMTVVKKSHVGDAEYVNVSTLTNDMDVEQSLKTSDFAHTYTDTFQYTYKSAEQVSRKMSIKQTIEEYSAFWLPFGEKGKVEISMEYNMQFTFEETWAWTTTDTRTYTVSGQTVKVPAKSSLVASTDWYRAHIEGEITCINPLDPSKLSSKVGRTMSDHVFVFSTPFDMKAAIKLLGLSKIATQAKVKGVDTTGLFLYTQYEFSTDVGVVGNYRVTPVPYVPLKGNLEFTAGQLSAKVKP